MLWEWSTLPSPFPLPKRKIDFLMPTISRENKKVTISDLIQIAPQDFEKRSAQAIEDNINAKYSDKVIHKIGLCVCLYDIISTSDGLIGHGTGIVNVNVDFRLVVFRPFKGEILQGRIVGCSDFGIKISLDFFDDVFVPAPGMLFENSTWDAAEATWIWHAGEGNDFYFDRLETVRVRVETEVWNDLSPQQQRPTDAGPVLNEKGEVVEDDMAGISPYQVMVSP